jgi:CRISPR/Cas system-associated exonuclease Cas4 (RecB family)
MQYKYRYILRGRLKENVPMMFGSALHNAIKIGYDYELERPDWLKVFKREWIMSAKKNRDVFSSESEYIDKLKEGQAIIGKYYKGFVEGVKPPIAIESKFRKIPIGNHTVLGIIDQISGDRAVIDYKTGYRVPSNSEMALDLQFTMYSYAYRHIYQEEESALILRNIRMNKDVYTQRTEKDYKLLESIMNGVSKAINAQLFYRHIGWGCQHCSFYSNCLGKIKASESAWSTKLRSN